jgi:hypothetical protein
MKWPENCFIVDMNATITLRSNLIFLKALIVAILFQVSDLISGFFTPYSDFTYMQFNRASPQSLVDCLPVYCCISQGP